MTGRFFEPDDKICLIFDNVKYDKLREIPEFSKRHPDKDYMGSLQNELECPDLPRAREWADTFEEGIKAYGFGEDQIYRHKDADYDTMHSAIFDGANSARSKIEQNSIQGRRTLLLCFYAGHGVAENS